MQYGFKQRLNKIDSQQYRNLQIPEIDVKLNEAIGIFIKMVAEPKFRTRLGFEKSQRTIDDIRTLVVNGESCTITNNTDSYIVTLPNDYLYFIGADKAVIKKGSCEKKASKINLVEHDDDFKSSFYDKPSFLWGEISFRFFEDGLNVFTGDFNLEEFYMNYIKVHPFVHNAEDFRQGSYVNFDGTNLTGTQDCILPEQTHSEIVDIAVAVTTGDLQIPDYEIKRAKLNMNQLNQ